MRKQLLLSVAAASLTLWAGTSAQAQPYSNAVMALNPAGYWPLSETVQPPAGAYIASNLGTAGAAANGFYQTWFQKYTSGANTLYYQTNTVTHGAGATADGNQALVCQTSPAGAGSYVVFPRTTNGVYNPAVALKPPFAIEFWVKPAGVAASVMSIVTEGRVPALDSRNGNTNANWTGFSVGQWAGNAFFATWNGSGGDATKQELDVPITTNVWQHLVINFDGTNQTWYKNGAYANTRAIPATSTNAFGELYTPDRTTPLMIGSGSDVSAANSGIEYAGSIDEVAIYTNLLTATAITNHYTAATNTDSTYQSTVLGDRPTIYVRLGEPAFNSYPDPSTYPVANNYGSLGAAANGVYQPGTTPGVAGPSYPGFGNSTAVAINGFSGGVDVGGGSVPAALNPTNNQPLTIAAWFKGNPADAPARLQSILSHGNNSFRLSMDANFAGLAFNPGKNSSDLGFSSFADVVTNGFFVNDGLWHFVTGVSDGTTASLYIDGKLARTAPAAAITGTRADLLLGGDPDNLMPSYNTANTIRYFDGNIAQVAFFTNALSASQVQGLYMAAGFAPTVRVQPVSQTAFAGGNVVLSPAFDGTTPMTFQWYKDNAPMAGQTNATLSFTPVSSANVGAYYVAVTNAYGWATSQVAQVSIGSSTLTPYASSVQSLKPAAYWPLDETTLPAGGQYIATNLGTAGVLGQGYYETWFQQVTGPMGQTTYYQTNSIQHVPGPIGDGGTAMLCNRSAGSGQYLVLPRSANGVPNPKVTLTPPFSVEFWANPYSTLGSVMCIITEGRNPALDSTFATANQSGFSIGQYGQNIFFATWNNTGGDSTKKELGVAFGATNVWHHCVVTFDGTNKFFYLDGVQAGNQTVSSYVVDMSSPLVIGTGSIPAAGNGAGEWLGALGEVAIYTNVLQLQDVQNHYNVRTATDNSYKNAVLANNPSIYLRLGEPAFNAYPSPSTYPVANNYGAVGVPANGFYQPGTTPGVPGPAYSGFGSASRAVAINGFSGAVTVGGGNLPAALNPTNNQPLTVAAWIQGAPADAPQRFQGIVSHGGASWRLALDNVGAGLRFNPGNNPEVQFSSVTDVKNSGAIVNDGKWHFVAGVSDGSTASLYIDGALIRSSSGVASIAGSWMDALIGGDPSVLVPVWNGGASTAPRYFAGNIAQVSFFTNALSAAQISQLYSVAGVPPTLTLQPPATATYNSGQTVSIPVAAQGSPTLAYQWYKTNGVAVSGQTNASLTFNPLAISDAGSYYAIVTNAYGKATSSVVTLTVYGPPQIVQQSLSDVRVFAGMTPTLHVSVIGAAPYYQWTSNNVAVAGANGPDYTLPLSATSVIGTNTYGCTITNVYGATALSNITVAVVADPQAPFAQRVLADRPVAFFRLNEPGDGASYVSGVTAYDYAGGNNAAYNNTILANTWPGFQTYDPLSYPPDIETCAMFGQSVSANSFAGNVPTYLNFGVTNGGNAQFSVEAWVNMGQYINNGNAIVALGTGNGGEQFVLDTGNQTNASSTIYGLLRFFVRNAAGTVCAANSTNYIVDGNWHHVAGVCDQAGGHVYVYLDGKQVGSASIPSGSGLLSSTVPLSIGARQSGNTTPANYDFQFVGLVEDVALYGSALSASQVAAHFGSTNPVPAITLDLQPTNQTVWTGVPLSFSVQASGALPLSYQWYVNGAAVNGATNTSYSFSSVAGRTTYYCVANNSHGSATSSVATVTGMAAVTLNPADYTDSMKITFAGYNRGETLADFPVLVRLSTNLAGFNYRHFASGTGADLRFTDAIGTRVLPSEIDEWNTNGESTVWVQVSRLSSTNDCIWAYWGNPAATTPLPGTNVWVPQAWEGLPAFDVVYHLKEGALPFADATSQYPATNGTAPGKATGIVGTGGAFSSAQATYLEAGSVATSNQFTVSAWVNIATSVASGGNEQTIWANKVGGWNSDGWDFYVNGWYDPNGVMFFDTGDGTDGQVPGRTTSGAVSFGQWHLLTGVLDGVAGVTRVYIDGVDRTINTATLPKFSVTNNVRLGSLLGTGGQLVPDGVIDEARIQAGVNSPNWIWASYMTVASNATWQSYSTVTSRVPATLPPAVTGLTPVRGWTNGGTLVSITGSNFLSGATVQFGASSAASVNCSSSMLLTALTPAGVAGPVNVTVINPDGQASTLAGGFTYVLPPVLGSMASQVSGRNLVLNGNGGTNAAGFNYQVWATANLAPATWVPVSTNLFDGNGTFSVTNAIDPNQPRLFYRIVVPPQ